MSLIKKWLPVLIVFIAIASIAFMAGCGKQTEMGQTRSEVKNSLSNLFRAPVAESPSTTNADPKAYANISLIGKAAASAGNADTASLLAKAAQQAGLTQTKVSNATGLDTSATVAGNYGSALAAPWHMKPAK